MIFKVTFKARSTHTQKGTRFRIGGKYKLAYINNYRDFIKSVKDGSTLGEWGKT